MPAATPAKRARQRANKAARKAEDATNTDTTATTIETLPIDDSLHDATDHLSPDSSYIPAFISPNNVEHVAIWRAAATEAFERGLKAGVELAEKQMKDKFEQLENMERRNRQILLLAEVAGKEEGVNEERTRWLAVYPDTVFSEFNENTFPETVPLAPAAQPPPPITRSVATQVTLPVPQVRLVLLPPATPPTNEMSTQTMPEAEDTSPPTSRRWSDDSDDPNVTSHITQPSPFIPVLRARDFSELKSSDNPWKSLQYRRGRDRRRGQRFSQRSRHRFPFSQRTRPSFPSYDHADPFPDPFHPSCPCMQVYRAHAPPWMTRSWRPCFS